MPKNAKLQLIVQGTPGSVIDIGLAIRASGARIIAQLDQKQIYLVEISRKRRKDLFLLKGLVIRGVSHFRPATWEGDDPSPPPPDAIKRTHARLKFWVVSASDETVAIHGARVKYFMSGKTRCGKVEFSDERGLVSLAIGKENDTPRRVIVHPPPGYWGRLVEKERFLNNITRIKLLPIDIYKQDGMRFHCNDIGGSEGDGVIVGIIDGGIGPHPDLIVSGGLNFIPGEPDSSYHDCGTGHGTHIAGIIASRSEAPGARGLAPAVTLRSYRVFANGSTQANSFYVVQAIDQAVKDGCHIINLSMSNRLPDPDIQDAISRAFQAGCLIVAAAGNDFRKTPAFPGSAKEALCVASCGVRGRYPNSSIERDEEAAPFCPDSVYYLAASSNIGDEEIPIDLIAPGVGVVSAAPGGGYMIQGGTSMACASVTAFAARLLSSGQLTLPEGGADRVEQLKEAILARTRIIFKNKYVEGRGSI